MLVYQRVTDSHSGSLSELVNLDPATKPSRRVPQASHIMSYHISSRGRWSDGCCLQNPVMKTLGSNDVKCPKVFDSHSSLQFWAIIFMAIPALSSPAAWSVSPWYHLFVVDMTWKPTRLDLAPWKLSNSKEDDRKEFYISMIAPFYPKYTPILPPSTPLRSLWCSTMTVFQVLAQTPPTPHRSSLARGRRPYPEEAADLHWWRECLKMQWRWIRWINYWPSS